MGVMGKPTRRLVVWLAASLGLVVAVFGIGESMGWPWLAQPIERALSGALHRPVSLAASAGGGDASVRVHLLGAVRLDAARLEIADLPS